MIIIFQFGIGMYAMIFLKQIINKDPTIKKIRKKLPSKMLLIKKSSFSEKKIIQNPYCNNKMMIFFYAGAINSNIKE